MNSAPSSCMLQFVKHVFVIMWQKCLFTLAGILGACDRHFSDKMGCLNSIAFTADELPIQAAHRGNDCCWLGQDRWGSSVWLPHWWHPCKRKLDNRWLWQHIYLGSPGCRVQVELLAGNAASLSPPNCFCTVQLSHGLFTCCRCMPVSCIGAINVACCLAA